MTPRKNALKLTFVFGVFFVLLCCFFGRFLSSNHILLTTDAAVSDSNITAQTVFHTIFSNWHDGILLGFPREATSRLPRLLKAVFSGVLWNNLVYGIALLLSSVVLALFLLRQGISGFAAILAGVAAFWLGSNFTLIYAGHTLKPYVILFYTCALISAQIPSWRGGILWGASVGIAFTQQPDVAMFFALFAGGNLLFMLWRREALCPIRWLPALLPAIIVALLFASGPLLSGYQHHVKNTAQVQVQNPQEKWDYMTQWSFPPEESIAFIAPGYTGWRSGEPDGPYWGRMGRSAGWEQTRQGFQNFKLENIYLGLIPVAFALFALFSCWRSKHKAEILFWGGAALVALLLSFGKFFPLYSVFYKLPVVNNVRNPNKFLQVFQVCLAILTAYGADRLFSQKSKVDAEKAEGRSQRPEVRIFFWVTVGTLGIFGIWALSLTVDRSGDIRRFMAMGWPQDAARVIVSNKIIALWHASFMAAVVCAVFSLFSFPMFGKTLRFKRWIAAGLVLIVAADAVKLSKHYVKEMPRSYIEANALTDFLKKDLGEQRVALLARDGIYNIWLTYLLPYNQIPTFNFAQMPRMSTDYQAFLDAGQRNPLNLWRFSAVKYLLGPSAAEMHLEGQARKVFVYDLASAGANEFRVVATPSGAHAVFELLNTSPRYAVIAPVDSIPDDQTLAAVAKLPHPQVGSAEVISYRSGKVKLRVNSDAPSMLRIAEKWDIDWRAEVDGAPAEVQRVDYLCQGVSLPAGESEVELRYSPSKLFFYMQCAGGLVLLGALVAMIRNRYENA